MLHAVSVRKLDPTDKSGDNRSGMLESGEKLKAISEAVTGWASRWVFVIFFALAVFLNYLPDLAPTYISAFSGGRVRVVGSLNQYREGCDLPDKGDWTCRNRYRIPNQVFAGHEAIGLGVILFPTSFRCAVGSGETVFAERLDDVGTESASNFLKKYQTFELGRLNCTSDLYVENWVQKGTYRHGLSQSPAVVGEKAWVNRAKNLVELSITSVMSFAVILFLVAHLIFILLGRITNTELRYPPFDRFKYFWLGFIAINLGYLFETILPINPPYLMVPRLSNFLGLMILVGPITSFVATSQKISVRVRHLAQRIFPNEDRVPWKLMVFCALIIGNSHFRLLYPTAVLLFSMFGLCLAILESNIMFALFASAAFLDGLKIFKVARLPASRVAITYLLFVIIYELYQRIKYLERNARFEAGTEAVLALSHDIRAPLTTMRTLIPRLDGSPEAKGLILESLERIRGISKSLLERSKGDFHVSTALEVIDLRTVLASIVDVFRRELAENRTQIEFQSTLSESLTTSDAVALNRVFSNLLSNSIQALGEKSGNILVTLNSVNEQFVIAVQDDGVGINPQALESLGRIRTFTTKSDGNGLGLYISKKITEQLGGSLKIISKPGSGTIVEVRLPMRC